MTTSATAREKLIAARNILSHQSAQHQACIERLVKLSGRIKTQQRLVLRLERSLKAKVEAELATFKPAQAKAAPAPLPPETVVELKKQSAVLNDAIPAFLDRRSPTQKKDDEARAKIEAAVLARKKAKTAGRLAKMKAKQSGDTRKMPLTGRAALAAINQFVASETK